MGAHWPYERLVSGLATPYCPAARFTCQPVRLKQFWEEIPGGPAGRLAQFLERAALDLGDDFRNFLHVGRLTTFAPIGRRCEIRAIGFQHELVQRRGGYRVTDVLAVLEGDIAGKA